jgi:hypothetical protein
MKAAELGKITLREEAVRLKTLLRVVADITPRDVHPDRTLIMLAYASMGLLFRGTVPRETVSLARCIQLLRQFPWMKARAFDFLSRLTGSAWPYLIGKWDELEAELERETGCRTEEYTYAPRTYRMLHEIVAQRCDKPFCSHPKDAHNYDGETFSGRCLVPGCNCGFFKPPRWAELGPITPKATPSASQPVPDQKGQSCTP